MSDSEIYEQLEATQIELSRKTRQVMTLQNTVTHWRNRAKLLLTIAKQWRTTAKALKGERDEWTKEAKTECAIATQQTRIAQKAIADRDHWRTTAATLEAERAELMAKYEMRVRDVQRLRAVVEAVEWISGESREGVNVFPYKYCPWCDAGTNHAPDCPRQAALKESVE